jgi:3-hydroxyisobutyrate dehydrogenase-like beta-hydroxyacid dehydrogenase
MDRRDGSELRTSLEIGFIGLGGMGLPMAKRIVQAGFPVVTTCHCRREPAAELAALGATVVDTPAQVARAARVVITIVPADAELRECALGPDGLLAGFSPGKVLIDMTTATAMALQDVAAVLAQAGVRVLDAPVSGGTSGAAKGTLTIMVGGEADLLEECRPVLAAIGTKIVHVGALGQGKVVKMVNQMMAAVHVMAIGEAFSLGVRCGADPATLYEVIKTSSGYSKMMDLRLPGFLLEGSFQPGFKLDLMRKDVQIALDSGRAQGVPLLLAGTVAQLFSAVCAAGKGGQDYSCAAQFVADLVNVQLTRPPACAESEHS